MKLKYDKLLSNVGFNFNLRHYNVAASIQRVEQQAAAECAAAAAAMRRPLLSLSRPSHEVSGSQSQQQQHQELARAYVEASCQRVHEAMLSEQRWA